MQPTRRKLFRQGGLLAAFGFFRPGAAQTARVANAGALQIGPNIYESIGVRPIVNCRGTFTIITGSQSLPEVKRAMDEASRHYVHLDELMEAVGKRLAELTKSEWGIVTAGCAAAITHATAACIAGTDPEKMQQLPDLSGLKNEVIMPRYSRNVYDHAARMTGVKIVEVETPEQLERAINPKTAMAMILACP
jgi:L-seryl-tRNA(Ser) seleniumtransferase